MVAAPMGLPLLGRARDGDGGGGGRGRDSIARRTASLRDGVTRGESEAELVGRSLERWTPMGPDSRSRAESGVEREDGTRERVHNPPSVNILYHRVTRNAKLPRNALRWRLHL